MSGQDNLELELLIIAWDNFKKNGTKESDSQEINDTIIKIDEGMMDLLDKKEAA